MKHDSIAIMIKLASTDFDKQSNQALAPFDMTNSQYKVLKYILTKPELSVRQIDIENYFSMSNPTVTGLLQNMEKHGLIERAVNPEDKRSKVIRVTDKVRAEETELIRLGTEMEDRFTQNLSDEEKQQMKELLRKLLGE